MSTIYELRFAGRSGSLFTSVDVTPDIGVRLTRTIPVAISVFDEGEVDEARDRLTSGAVVTAVADMAKLAYVIEHQAR